MKSRYSGLLIANVDMWIAFAVAWMAMAVLIVPAPPVDTINGDKPICSMAIDVEWAGNVDADVDLWAKAPNDKVVGYSSKDGTYLNHVRDDLGFANDKSTINQERICGRGFSAGEYIVNLHLYSIRNGTKPPVNVKVTVNIVDVSSAFMEQIFKTELPLTYLAEELTVVRFSLDERGRLIRNSINDLPIAIRAEAYGGTRR